MIDLCGTLAQQLWNDLTGGLVGDYGFDPFGLGKPAEYLQFELDLSDQNLAKNVAGNIIRTRFKASDIKSTPFQPYSKVELIEGWSYLGQPLPFSITTLIWIEVLVIGYIEFQRNAELDPLGSHVLSFSCCLYGLAFFDKVKKVKHRYRLAQEEFLRFTEMAANGAGAERSYSSQSLRPASVLYVRGLYSPFLASHFVIKQIEMKTRARVISLALILAAAAITPSSALCTTVRNSLSDGKKMTLHCRSKDDDLCTREMSPGEEYWWEFGINTWGTTLFYCTVSQGSVQEFAFDAFDDKRDGKRCEKEGGCYWEVYDDGIYFRFRNGEVDLYYDF